MIRNTSRSWGAAAKFFHWTTALLVLAQFALGWVAVCWPFSPLKAHLYVWHKSLGILLLAFVLLRLGWRFANPVPVLPDTMPPWESRCARLSYLLLYAILIAMPISGWILNSAANVPVRIFWLLPLPSLTDPSQSTAKLASLAHLSLFTLLVTLLLVHVAAALRHHFVMRNDVLTRMLPSVRRRAAASFAVIAIVLVAALPRPTHAAEWMVDRASSRLEFIATFESAPAPGVFREFDTRVHLDADRPHEGRINVKIVTASADMMSPGFNKAIRAREWFDALQFPHAEFHSSEVRRLHANTYVARGTLYLKGVRRAVEVPFVWSEAPDGAAMRGEVTVKRADFGIGMGEWIGSDVVGADVTVRFNLQLRRSG